MNIILEDSHCRDQLFPFTYTRHIADIRIGILTIRQKWERLTGQPISAKIGGSTSKELIINANIIPSLDNFKSILSNDPQQFKGFEYPWQLFQLNDEAIRMDFQLLTKGRKSQAISSTNKTINKPDIFIEEGAQVEHSILNASTGPIYIGKKAVVMEASLIRGPFALGEHAVLKMGSRVYGATTIGPYCIAGGEIKNSILMGFSNKAHDGYLGDSVIGEWCNLGAGTSNSNIKNTAGEVRYILNKNKETIGAGHKGGLLMGDYSRSAINTSFNTATVVGVCCNIFGNSMPSKYIANFSWGIERYDLNKAIKDIDNWKKLKGFTITDQEMAMITRLYNSKQ
ncbi:MAG: putative sugar nucleotidyl transferase [Ferruginibacter sp.]